MPAAPDFDAFFKGTFQRALDTVQVPGEPDTSWDRKAAYLLWVAVNNGGHVVMLREGEPAIEAVPAESIFA